YHVMSRGNGRRRIVRDDADRQRRCDWLARTVEIYGWRVHAFCLMTNHEHLFVETPEPNLSAGMQHLNGSYTSGGRGVRGGSHDMVARQTQRGPLAGGGGLAGPAAIRI